MSNNNQIKIVQSFWSKPFYKDGPKHFGDRGFGGWGDRSHFYMSWALSCLKIKELYDHVELVTDQFGKSLLIDLLQLPYTSVVIELDEINHFNTDLWAIGKIYAYAAQEEPFVHIDGDVFLWKEFSEPLISSPLIAQHEEYNYIYYHDALKCLAKEGLIIHPLLKQEQDSGAPIIASNAGILGGQDFSFFKLFKKEVMDFINNNQGILNGGFSTGLFNNIYEQYLFNRLANHHKVPISYLFNDISYNYEGICDFHRVPHFSSFIHVLGIYKRKYRNGELVKALLKFEFPEYFYKIKKLLDEFAI